MYKLLIVEDENGNEKAYGTSFDWEGMGIEVGCACNGMEGESIAKASGLRLLLQT